MNWVPFRITPFYRVVAMMVRFRHGTLLLVCLHASISVIAGCAVGEFNSTYGCTSCFANEQHARTRCRYLCDSGFPVKKCTDVCRYLCINESCIMFAKSCFQSCARNWYGDDCDKPCSAGCNGAFCNRIGNCPCMSGYYGSQCNKHCPQTCQGGACDADDGRCIRGCKTDWYGDSCDSKCPTTCSGSVCDQKTGECLNGCERFLYGRKCNHPCPTKCNNTQCTDGICDGCTRGYKGPICNVSCPEDCAQCHQYDNSTCLSCVKGRYGPTCEKTCDNCLSGTCDMDGNCSDTCSTSEEMPACKLRCANGWYGAKCDKHCSMKCKDGKTCDHITGACTGGCSGSFYGKHCTHICSTQCIGGVCDQSTGTCMSGCETAFFGVNCNLTCSPGCFLNECDQETGACTKGCYSSVYGTHCNYSCLTGTYGYNCSQTCNDKCVGQDCGIMGVCRLGCVHGWMGNTCHYSILWAVLPSICVAAMLLTVCLKRYRIARLQQKRVSSKIGTTDVALVLFDRGSTDTLNIVPPLRMGPRVVKCSDTTRVALDQFKEYVTAQRLTSGLIKQFSILPVSPMHPCYEGDLSRSTVKNRYEDIKPYDHNRVVLERDSAGLSSDYINASYIEGYENTSSFIAAQGPFSETMTEFWEMIWQENVSKIVMLTSCVENGRKKCEKYWPELGQTLLITSNTTVECLGESVGDDFTIRTFIFLKDGIGTRQIKQFHFTKWSDCDVPDNVTSLVHLHTTVTTSMSSVDGPVLVHCSAGVGRTGTYIALDYLLQQAKAEGAVDVYDCVLRLRHQRINMVQTEEQYVLLHDALLQAMESDGHLHSNNEPLYRSPLCETGGGDFDALSDNP